jgi:hypothetical protein
LAIINKARYQKYSEKLLTPCDEEPLTAKVLGYTCQIIEPRGLKIAEGQQFKNTPNFTCIYISLPEASFVPLKKLTIVLL